MADGDGAFFGEHVKNIRTQLRCLPVDVTAARGLIESYLVRVVTFVRFWCSLSDKIRFQWYVVVCSFHLVDSGRVSLAARSWYVFVGWRHVKDAVEGTGAFLRRGESHCNCMHLRRAGSRVFGNH